MAALVCDICGGKLSMGAGGIAVCGSCGMEHSKDRMQEKIQEIKGTVRIDNSHLVDNYLDIATNAYDAKNFVEAESYCNKIIEIDPTNYRSWLLKGMSAGWQSTIANPRLEESGAAFSKAIANAPEEQRVSVLIQTHRELSNLSKAFISLRSNHFKQWPDEEEKNEYLQNLTYIQNMMGQFLSQYSDSLSNDSFMEPIADQIYECITDSWNDKILPDYKGSENRPNESEWKEFISRISYCTELLTIAIDLSADDSPMNELRYELLIKLEDAAIISCSWNYDYTDSGKEWHKEFELTDLAKGIRKDRVSKYRANIAKLRAQLKESRNNRYWEKHAEEKRRLETENKNLETLITTYEAEIQNLQTNQEIANLKNTQKALENNIAELGIFKRQEKKALQERLKSVSTDLDFHIKQRDDLIQQVNIKLEPLKKTFTANRRELIKAR